VHLDGVAGIDDRDPRWRRTPERALHLFRSADERDLGLTALRSVQQRAPDDLVRGVIAAHRIDRDAHGVLGGSLLCADLDHLAAAVRPAARAGLMRRLGALALRARDEGDRLQPEVAASLALGRVRGALLGLTSHSSGLLIGGDSPSSVP